MKKIHIIAAAALALLSVTNTQAQSRRASENGYYGEVGYSAVGVSGTGGDATPEAIRFVFGNEVNKNLGVEAIYTNTLSKESRPGYDASFNGFGVFLKPKMALSNDTEAFARIGVLRADITASTGGSHTGTDMAYGLGIQTNFSPSVYGQLDYMHSYDRDSVAAKGYTLSLGARF
jgi:opacity protein-like surface antigen